MKFARAAGDTCMISQNFTFVHVKVRALTKHARSEADALVSPRAGKKKKTAARKAAEQARHDESVAQKHVTF